MICEKKDIITEDNVAKLREYISTKYSSYTSSQRADIFANAIHKILDNTIPNFNENDKTILKRSIFSTLLEKSSFNINYCDIFEASLKLKVVGNIFLKELRLWLSDIVSQQITKESLYAFVTNVHKLLIDAPEKSIGEILTIADAKIGGIQSEKNLEFRTDMPLEQTDTTKHPAAIAQTDTIKQTTTAKQPSAITKTDTIKHTTTAKQPATIAKTDTIKQTTTAKQPAAIAQNDTIKQTATPNNPLLFRKLIL